MYLFISHTGKQYQLWFNISFVSLFTTFLSHQYKLYQYPGSVNLTCKLCLPECLNNYTGHICWAFLHYVPLYEFSAWLFEPLQIFTSRIFLQYVPLYECSDSLFWDVETCTGHTCWIFLHYVPSYECSDSLF